MPGGRPGDAGRGIEELLHRALSGEAEAVGVSPDALQLIRGRIERRRTRWWVARPGALRVIGAVAAAAAVVAAVVLGIGGLLPDQRQGPRPGPVGAGRSAAAPVPTANLPVYYLGTGAQGQRLYREYHQVPVGGPSIAARIEAAVGAMLGLAPSDPDYRSPWPAGARVGAVSIDGSTATVDLSGAGNGPAAGDAGPDAARTALEQLVWTVTAASVPPAATGAPGSAAATPSGPTATPPGGLTGVVLRLDGHAATTFWGTPLSGQPLHRRPAVDVQAPVWVIDPQQGMAQRRDFVINLAGIVPEATMRLRIRTAAGALVSDQSVHLSAGAPAVGTAAVRVSLDPGSYTVEGYVVSARDGSEQWPDEHSFTVG
jgi:hypothetical protein